MHTASQTIWRPLFSDDESAPYRAAIDAVAAELERPSREVFIFSRRSATANNAGIVPAADLASGKAGLAILFAYLHLHSGHPRHREISERLLHEALGDIASTAFSARFFFGWTGVAWTAAHLDSLPTWNVDEGTVGEVVRIVERLVRQSSWANQQDLVSGLAGIGVYALERMPRPAAAAGLAAVISQLGACGVTDEGEDCWLAAPVQTRDDVVLPDADDSLEQGLAHGIPGMIALLAEAHAAGVAEARPLLEKAVNWSLERIPPLGTSDLFMHARSHAGTNGHWPRQSWCDGAPGMAAALMVAAHRTGYRPWRDSAIDLAVRAADTPLDQCLIADHSLCQGAAGVAHLYNRMYQATGHEGLREGARTWFRRLLDMRHDTSGVGGFLAYLPRRSHGDPWVADAGLMTGAAGAALAMLAATSDVEPNWDRMMLVSVPPVASGPRVEQPPRTRPATGATSTLPRRPV